MPSGVKQEWFMLHGMPFLTGVQPCVEAFPPGV